MKKLILKNNQPQLVEDYFSPMLKPGEILVQVKAVGLCRTDLLVAAGKIPAKDGLVLGHEFSGIVIKSKSSKIEPGEQVAVNPFLANGSFMGLDIDGCLANQVVVHEDQVIAYKGLSFKQAAYLEPVAASMAVLKANISSSQKVAVWGFNRIAELTSIVLNSLGINAVQTTEVRENYYDAIIETQITDTDLSEIITSLKNEGLLIIKSRKKTPTNFYASDLVKKEITLKAVNYYDFNKSMRWLEENFKKIDHLLGEEFDITEYEKAFELANSSESKKIFITL